MAVPFWDGILSAVASVAIGFVATMTIVFVLAIAALALTGKTPSLLPGHLLLGFGTLAFYVAGGWFAWARLRRIHRPLLRLRAVDARAIAIGFGALVLVRVAGVIQLVLTHQTHHVQSGMEHFSVAAKAPLVTALATALAFLVMVLLGPLVEEIVFRGLVFGALLRPLGTIGAALLSGLIFGAVHGDLVLFPTLAALGIINALAYAATGNLTVAVVLHAINNLFATIFLVGSSLLR